MLQTELNQQIYEDLRHYLDTAGQIVDKEQAFQLLVNAVSTNLGAILAQVPDAYRNDFIQISNDIITASLTAGADAAATDGELEMAYDLFANKETVDPV